MRFLLRKNLSLITREQVMIFKSKLTKAHQELENAAIWPSNYNPPLLDLFRKLGYRIPPPHYRGFLINFTSQTLFFTTIWGAIMWLLVWQTGYVPVYYALLVSSSVGLFFGFSMAVYYKFSAAHHHLSDWSDFTEEPTPSVNKT
ncbi:DUF6404 family protein [Psychromonas sp.]|uniref:DUF6404 family protein n=1 Tax=Psychromonas sp. TaxID=1884585 RepID=UPI0039E4756C